MFGLLIVYCSKESQSYYGLQEVSIFGDTSGGGSTFLRGLLLVVVVVVVMGDVIVGQKLHIETSCVTAKLERSWKNSF